MVHLKTSYISWLGLRLQLRRGLKVTLMDSTVSFSKGKRLALGLNDSTYSIRTFDLPQNSSHQQHLNECLPIKNTASDSDGLPYCSDA